MRDANDCQASYKILEIYSGQLHNDRTMKTKNTIEEIRLTNLRLLIEECEAVTVGRKVYRAGSAAALAAKSKTSASYLSQILIRFKNPSGTVREVGTLLARKLEKGAKKPLGWMDTRHDDIELDESEFRQLYAAMGEDQKEIILEHARLISKIGKK